MSDIFDAGGRVLGAVLDHLVYATPDLEATVDEIGRALGVRPVPGGRHLGLGTRNALVGLGEGYLEIIGPDSSEPPPVQPRPFGIDALTAHRLVTWAIRVAGIDEAVARARLAGYDPGVPLSMSRRRPDGVELRWRLTPPAPRPDEGIVPFLIDWGETPHPARGLPAVDFGVLRAEHPDIGTVRRRLSALGVELALNSAPSAALLATLRGPGGEVTLR